MKNSIAINKNTSHFIDCCLIGDGSIQKVGRLSFCRQNTDYEYSTFIFNKLRNLFSKNRSIKEDFYYDKRTNKSYGRIQYTSLTTRELKDMEERWYNDRIKILPEDIVFDEELISILYLDDGYFVTEGVSSASVGICTNSFTLRETELIADKIEKELNLLNKIKIHRHDKKDQFRLKISSIDSMKILYCMKRYCDFYSIKPLKYKKAMSKIDQSHYLKKLFNKINDDNFYNNTFLSSEELKRYRVKSLSPFDFLKKSMHDDLRDDLIVKNILSKYGNKIKTRSIEAAILFIKKDEDAYLSARQISLLLGFSESHFSHLVRKYKDIKKPIRSKKIGNNARPHYSFSDAISFLE